MGAECFLKRARAILVLGRISNLPTVWSNCLAAWLLGGGGLGKQFALLCFGATLLYTGGMFLNDAMDVEFDRKFRPERPIISGQVSPRFVAYASAILLLGGWLCLLPLGPPTLLYGLVLAAIIVLYDVVHKQTNLAPVLMAGCRFFLYLTAASAGARHDVPRAFLAAAGLGIYIIGLSYIARRESTTALRVRWPIPLLFVPLALPFVQGAATNLPTWIAALGVGSWVVWCIASPGRPGKGLMPRGIAGLLAGIALLDWLTASALGVSLACACAGLFLLAILLQRIAPAT